MPIAFNLPQNYSAVHVSVNRSIIMIIIGGMLSKIDVGLIERNQKKSLNSAQSVRVAHMKLCLIIVPKVKSHFIIKFVIN